jgi:hypothetical protein
MLFEITTSQQSTLPVSRPINPGLWLHTVDDRLSFGYQLNDYGGNFLNFEFYKNSLLINFGFYKDYVLSQDLSQGVLLSSTNLYKTKVNSSLISASTTTDNQIKFQYYDLKSLMMLQDRSISLTDAAAMVETVLVENLCSLQAHSPNDPLKITYSAGLDSGTVTWLCYKHKINFVSLITLDLLTRCQSFPFKVITSKMSTPTSADKFNRDAWQSFVVPNNYFCNVEHNNYVSGYYGDLTMLHLRSMYTQSKDLATVNLNDAEYYDLNDSQDEYYTSLKFRNKQELVNSIIKIHLQTHAQEWFMNFETRDPYRDPRFLKIFLSLHIDDLIKQFKSAIVQKTIINNVGPECWKFLCSHKNDYDSIGQHQILT